VPQNLPERSPALSPLWRVHRTLRPSTKRTRATERCSSGHPRLLGVLPGVAPGLRSRAGALRERPVTSNIGRRRRRMNTPFAGGRRAPAFSSQRMPAHVCATCALLPRFPPAWLASFSWDAGGCHSSTAIAHDSRAFLRRGLRRLRGTPAAPPPARPCWRLPLLEAAWLAPFAWSAGSCPEPHLCSQSAAADLPRAPFSKIRAGWQPVAFPVRLIVYVSPPTLTLLIFSNCA